ncbi:MAG TPA: GNAT family N-acetyltransferase [Solimonas sp.]|nr:GNAT family N-acetyltransferase [Solimonas sp.]
MQQAGGPSALRLRQVSSIAQVSAGAWDALFDPAYPFAQHAFLHALESAGCVGGRTGWSPCHLLAEDSSGRLVGAAPLYLKTHSFGEFVFDWAWAEAAGRSYYPKLVCAIPFSPVAGPRLGAADDAVRNLLAAALARMPGEAGASSTHALFLRETELAPLLQHGLIERRDLQFHWHNAGYARFDALLATLRADKRKKIQRERRRVAEAGIRFEVRSGDELGEADWHEIYALYANTYEERGQPPYLTPDFFLDYGRRAGTPLRLIVALEGQRRVAAAITLVGGDTLYGRHWGAAEHYHSLHFETCYYQGIEFCIEQGLAHFDAGAQGEHKLARGFVPQLTHSAHRLRDPRLHAAVETHLRRERAWVESRRLQLEGHAPFKDAHLDG